MSSSKPSFVGLIIISTFIFLSTSAFANDQSLSAEKEAKLNRWILSVQRLLETRAKFDANSLSQDDRVTVDEYIENYLQDFPNDIGDLGDPDDVISPIPPDDEDPNFPTDPIDGPIDYELPDYPLPYSSRRSGSSEIIALEVMYQTFMFYGVYHIVEKKRSRVDFKIIKSKSGYFMNLTKLDVAYAIREFARYFRAHLCNKANMENFYAAFAQVPPEEIGLRFKYDMAWALLGNNLPKEPNSVFLMGSRWKALKQILGTTSSLKPKTEETKELKSWASSISDVINILTRLNKLMCFVDIRPKPKDELKKRIVVKKLLNLQKQINERYGKVKDLLAALEKSEKDEKKEKEQQKLEPPEVIPEVISPIEP